MELLGPTLALQALERLTYREAFQKHAGLDPFAATPDDFRRTAGAHGIQVSPEILAQSDPDAWRDLLLTHAVEPKLGQGRLTFIYDYPASQAALARIQPGDPSLAARFELYLNGIELANGFHELADADEQRARFERHLHTRAADDLPTVPMDERLLAALQHGLPDCAGVALGFDRLVMLACGARTIEEVLAFPLDRA
jgi:lysyl-tRNA synthetase class 2